MWSKSKQCVLDFKICEKNDVYLYSTIFVGVNV